MAAVTDSGSTGRWAESIVRSPIVAPELALVETTNVLRRLELAQVLPRLEAAEAARDILRFDLELVPFAPFASRIWELRGSVTAYDAWYVAIAEEFDLPLATLDRKLAASQPPRCRFALPPRT